MSPNTTPMQASAADVHARRMSSGAVLLMLAVTAASSRAHDRASVSLLQARGWTLVTRSPDSRPDFGVGRDRPARDHLADPGHVHQMLVVKILRDRVAAPGAAAERRCRRKSVRQGATR